MTRVDFHKLTVQNFQSIGEDEITVDFTKGVTFITGYNKDTNTYNGVGKTSILNALFFVLFGTAVDGKIKKNEMVNWFTNNTAVVSITFTVDKETYYLQRSLNPSRIHLERKMNGGSAGVHFPHAENLTQTMPQTDVKIRSLVCGDVEVYRNTMVMDTSNVPFLRKEPVKKVKFIEDILGLEAFTVLYKESKARFIAVGKEVSKLETQLESAEESISETVTLIDRWNLQRSVRLNDVESNIEKRGGPLVDYNPEILEAQSKLDEFETVLDKIELARNELSVKHGGKTDRYNKLEKEKRDLKTETACPTCKRPYDGQDDSNMEERLIDIDKEMEGILIEIEAILLKLDKSVSIIEKRIDWVRKTEAKLKDLKGKQQFEDSRSGYLETLEAKKVDIKAEINPYDEPLVMHTTKRDTFAVDLKEKRHRHSVLEVVRYLCSPDGVKADVLKQIISLVNSKLDMYLQKMGQPYRCRFDSTFEETIVNQDGREISYSNLSGGEKKRLDFAMMFTFRDIRRMQSNVSMNISMFDELFDSALCSVGMTAVLNILEEQSDDNDECIYIITHRQENLDTFDHDFIYLEKSGGITRKAKRV